MKYYPGYGHVTNLCTSTISVGNGLNMNKFHEKEGIIILMRFYYQKIAWEVRLFEYRSKTVKFTDFGTNVNYIVKFKKLAYLKILS